VDRKALPAPEWVGREQFMEPHTELGRQLAEVWRKVLSVTRVGQADNFFELGGNSLLATQLISKLRRELKLNVPLRLIFETETLGDFERAVYTDAQRVQTARPGGF
jgi:acyl carrier protein